MTSSDTSIPDIPPVASGKKKEEPAAPLDIYGEFDAPDVEKGNQPPEPTIWDTNPLLRYPRDLVYACIALLALGGVGLIWLLSRLIIPFRSIIRGVVYVFRKLFDKIFAFLLVAGLIGGTLYAYWVYDPAFRERVLTQRAKISRYIASVPSVDFSFISDGLRQTGITRAWRDTMHALGLDRQAQTLEQAMQAQGQEVPRALEGLAKIITNPYEIQQYLDLMADGSMDQGSQNDILEILAKGLASDSPEVQRESRMALQDMDTPEARIMLRNYEKFLIDAIPRVRN